MIFFLLLRFATEGWMYRNESVQFVRCLTLKCTGLRTLKAILKLYRTLFLCGKQCTFFSFTQFIINLNISQKNCFFFHFHQTVALVFGYQDKRQTRVRNCIAISTLKKNVEKDDNKHQSHEVCSICLDPVGEYNVPTSIPSAECIAKNLSVIVITIVSHY